jgi:CBS domain-containing protein
MIYKDVGALLSEQQTLTMTRKASVLDAAEQMAKRHIGAVPVMEDGQLVGLFTERDLLNRVVAVGRDPATVTLDQVMTRNPITIRADQSLAFALDTMFGNNFRHLPVLDHAGALVGLMSCRDVPTTYRVLRERWIEARAGLNSAA